MAAVPICKLKLFVDKDKGRVVLAEAGKDFIDVLLSFLALPLGTISKLLLLGKDEETERTPSPLGCFLNLYRSVQCLPEENFYNKSRKLLLEHPIYRKFDSCRKLMRKIDNGSKGLVKYYACPSASAACSGSYSFTLCTGTSNSPCLFCGTKMDKEVKEEDVPISEIFGGPKKSFILTDDMRVEVSRLTFTLSELSILGYETLLKSEKKEVDVTSKEVPDLLHCLFTSKTPLSDVYIEKKKKQSVGHDIIPRGVPEETEDKSKSQESEPVSLNVFVSKKIGGVKIRCFKAKKRRFAALIVRSSLILYVALFFTNPLVTSSCFVVVALTFWFGKRHVPRINVDMNSYSAGSEYAFSVEVKALRLEHRLSIDPTPRRFPVISHIISIGTARNKQTMSTNASSLQSIVS